MPKPPSTRPPRARRPGTEDGGRPQRATTGERSAAPPGSRHPGPGARSARPGAAPRRPSEGAFRSVPRVSERPRPLPIEARVERVLREGVTSASTRWVTGQLMAHDVSPAELAAALYQIQESRRPAPAAADRPRSGPGRAVRVRPAGFDGPRRSATAARPAGARAEAREPGGRRAGGEGRVLREERPGAGRPGRAARAPAPEQPPARPRVKGGPGARRQAAATPARGPRKDRPGGITGFARPGRKRED
jgi:hypothetical protein